MRSEGRWLSWLPLLLVAVAAPAADFMVGADVSHLRFFEDRGVVYRDGGQECDAPALLRRLGLTCVRLRLFTSDAAQALADPYNRINNLEYTVPLAVRARQVGLQLLLDFHYSDTWADPGHQAKPSAWMGLSFDDLDQRVYEYTSNSLAVFRAAGALPDYVQVGNEITSGFLWPDGRVGGAYDTPAQWSRFGRLLRAAIRGVRDGAGTSPPAILIHIDRGGDWAGTQWFFDNLGQQSVEFDAIGLSYYPFWHGDLNALRDCLNRAADRYHKPVAVLETAFPWTNSAPILGLPATPTGQLQYVAQLATVVKGVGRGLGCGVFWWGAEYQHLDGVNTAGFEYRSLFDAEGNVLPAAGALGQLVGTATLQAERVGPSLTLTWPLSGAGLSLTTTTNLESAVHWSPVTGPVECTGLLFRTTLPAQDRPTRFFRLELN